MLTLYVKTGCAYCARVLEVLDDLNLTATVKNIADEGVSQELIERGGERQVPYLVDEEHGVEMYESEDIAQYLQATYGTENE